MLVKIFTSALYGLDAITVTVEVNVLSGAKFVIVGLPDTAVRESQQRIDSALREIGERIPGKRVVINMAPAAIKKEGTYFDLPLAIGILSANDKLQSSILETSLMIGELSLDGTLQPVNGILPIAISAKQHGFKRLILPKSNANEASVVKGIEVFGFEKLIDVISFLSNPDNGTAHIYCSEEAIRAPQSNLDFADVKGQEIAKRALEIAACGSHNILLIGSPGAGKSMLSKRFPSILPPMTEEEALEVTKIHSVAGLLPPGSGILTDRPFRSPHHSTSESALIGGGTFPKPGEISLASNGCLYLDELPEFNRHTLELLRQPIEDREICITRVHGTITYPANFILVASMNPCPCGYYTDPTHKCTCTEGMVKKYLSKLSGPLLDRIDIQIEIVPVPFEKIAEQNRAESSASIRERVIKARKIQAQRFANHSGIYCNAQMEAGLLHKYAQPDEQGLKLLRAAMTRLNLSARAYDRILKVARTIADLAGCEHVTVEHLAEAISYRNLDRKGWGE